jgi:3-oxoacyl-[acyl-carrier protein] reductase
MKFQDKVVLITGASRGIGAAAARLFAAEGAHVIITYHSNVDIAQKILDELGERGTLIQADLSNKADVDNIFDTLSQSYASLDVLVNNVGVCKSQDMLELSLADWNNTLFTNLTSMFLCCQRAVPLLAKGGSIINVSSLRGLPDYGRPPIIDYSTSKAGVISLTKTLAKALAPKVRVNCVSPGVTNTEVTKTFSPDLLSQFVGSIYLGRLIEPIEVARTILFLASDDASAITGVNLMVDGGQSLSR